MSSLARAEGLEPAANFQHLSNSSRPHQQESQPVGPLMQQDAPSKQRPISAPDDGSSAAGANWLAMQQQQQQQQLQQQKQEASHEQTAEQWQRGSAEGVYPHRPHPPPQGDDNFASYHYSEFAAGGAAAGVSAVAADPYESRRQQQHIAEAAAAVAVASVAREPPGPSLHVPTLPPGEPLSQPRESRHRQLASSGMDVYRMQMGIPGMAMGTPFMNGFAGGGGRSVYQDWAGDPWAAGAGDPAWQQLLNQPDNAWAGHGHTSGSYPQQGGEQQHAGLPPLAESGTPLCTCSNHPCTCSGIRAS